MRSTAHALLVLGALTLGTTTVHAAVIDGKLDPAYGPAQTTQTCMSTMGRPPGPPGQVDYSDGQALDEGFGYVENGVLYLFFSGNLDFWWSLEGTTEWLPLDVFIDCNPGGQNQLLASNPTFDYAYDLKKMAGLTFDDGFTADYWLSLGGNLYSWPRLQAWMAELPASGGGAGGMLGYATCGGPGTLTGGTNPFGIMATLDDSNTGGVPQGCGLASGAGVTTGVEWAIPLAALRHPTGCIRVCAFLSYGDHSALFNQVVGPLPAGSCNLGAASSVNFAAIPGDQFFTMCSLATPVHPSSWGRLKTHYR